MNVKDITSIVAAILVAANATAAAAGVHTGLDDTVIYTVATFIASVGCVAWITWHNFNVTTAAKIGQLFTDSIKAGKLTEEEAQRFIDSFSDDE